MTDDSFVDTLSIANGYVAIVICKPCLRTAVDLAYVSTTISWLVEGKICVVCKRGCVEYTVCHRNSEWYNKIFDCVEDLPTNADLQKA